MSLRTATDKLHFIIEAVALVCALAFWAVYGFPEVWEFVAFGCVMIVLFVGYKWIGFQSSD